MYTGFFRDLALPIEDPIIIFTIVCLIILFAPLILKRFRLPGILGFMVAGILIGPEGFNILALGPGSHILIFGTVGLIYIMFFSGLEMNVSDFRRSSKKSLLFGFLTFIIPQTVGTIACMTILGLGIVPSILLSSVFSSHTLLSYPIASKLGLKNNEAVLVTIGGTLITNMVALTILAVVSSSTRGDMSAMFLIQMLVSFAIFIFVMFMLLPRIASWFFKHLESQGPSQFIFILAAVFFSASLAHVLGIESIIGAFLAGLALNRFVPEGSTLMNRIDFVGMAIFIPYFLIYVGMLIDIKAFFSGTTVMVIAVVITFIATGTKWFAAFITQRLLSFSKDQRDLIFGLSNAQAANTMAAVLVGVSIGVLTYDILNATVVMIFSTCMISAIITTRAGKRIALMEQADTAANAKEQEKFLVHISDKKTATCLVDLAAAFKDPKSAESLHLLIVHDSRLSDESSLADDRKLLDTLVNQASSSETQAKPLLRLDVNRVGGLIRTAKEIMATHILVDWDKKDSASEQFFGTPLDQLRSEVNSMIIVGRINCSLNVIQKIVVVIPPNTLLEKSFPLAIGLAANLTRKLKDSIHIIGTSKGIESAKEEIAHAGYQIDVSSTEFNTRSDMLLAIQKEISEQTLIMFVMPRRESISWDASIERSANHTITYFPSSNVVLVYLKRHGVSVKEMYSY